MTAELNKWTVESEPDLEEYLSICCAYELIDEQYEGIAYLTTGAA